LVGRVCRKGEAAGSFWLSEYISSLASPYWNNDKTGDWISVLLITNLYIYTLRCLSNKLHHIYSMTSTTSFVPEKNTIL